MIGWSLILSQLWAQSSFWDSDLPPQKPSQSKEYEYMNNFTEITGENIKEIMEAQENKFIFYFHPSAQTKQYLKNINSHAAKMKVGLRWNCYYVNMEKNEEVFSNFMKERETSLNIEEQIKNNTFILANKYDDIWFWDETLLTYFQGELLEQIFNFYGGIRILHDEHELMITLTENDNHFILYWNELNKHNNRKIKNFRRFQTKNTDSFLKIRFWIVKSEELAKRLGIDTTGEIGDMHFLKEWTKHNQLKSSLNIDGKDFYVQKLSNISDLK